MNSAMNARRLRILLMVIMLLIIAGSIGGFILIQRNLQNYATSISMLNTQAQSGDQDLQALRKLEGRLETDTELVQETESLLVDESVYIDQVIKDITRIGRESGVAVTGFEFVEADSAATGTAPSAGAATTAPTSPAATSPVTGSAPQTATATPNNIAKKKVSVKIANSISYTNYLTFLSRLEANKLKFLLPSVTLTRDQNGNIKTDQTLALEFYVRPEATR